jgi:2-amino-4-hydroxy-6-hydroxymethyldihydropteridine diphosphokinase
MAQAVLGIGSNLGGRRSLFRAAARLLHDVPGCSLLARSALYESAPLGPPQPDYLNGALRVGWEGEIDDLLRATQRVEQLLGRERRERWGARTLDIDLLHWSEGEVSRPGLEVPHRELAARPFALAPLLDVAPELTPMWGPVLHTLGGAPALADPSWLTLHRDGDSLHSDWLDDEAELIAIALELTARSVGSARHAVATMPFCGTRKIDSDRDVLWLGEVISHAAEQGFAVQSAAVTAYDAHEVSGWLLGHDVEPHRPSPAPPLLVEAREAGHKRVRILCTNTDDGVVSRGSVTM